MLTGARSRALPLLLLLVWHLLSTLAAARPCPHDTGLGPQHQQRPAPSLLLAARSDGDGNGDDDETEGTWTIKGKVTTYTARVLRQKGAPSTYSTDWNARRKLTSHLLEAWDNRSIKSGLARPFLAGGFFWTWIDPPSLWANNPICSYRLHFDFPSGDRDRAIAREDRRAVVRSLIAARRRLGNPTLLAGTVVGDRRRGNPRPDLEFTFTTHFLGLRDDIKKGKGQFPAAQAARGKGAGG